MYNYSSSPNSPLHWFYFNTRVLKVLYFHPFIVILICLPALKHLNIQKIFFMDRIVLPKYCFSIAKVVVTSFTKLVHIYYPKWLGECSSLRTQRCKNNLVRRWNCKPSSFTRVTSCESYGSSLLLQAALIINITKGRRKKILFFLLLVKKGGGSWPILKNLSENTQFFFTIFDHFLTIFWMSIEDDCYNFYRQQKYQKYMSADV